MTDPAVNDILATYNDDQKELLKHFVLQALDAHGRKIVYSDVIKTFNDDQLEVFYYIMGMAATNQNQRNWIKSRIYGGKNEQN